MRCRGLDLEDFWAFFFGISWEFLGSFLEILWKCFLNSIGILWEAYGRNDLSVRILGKSRRKEEISILRSAIASTSHLKIRLKS